MAPRTRGGRRLRVQRRSQAPYRSNKAPTAERLPRRARSRRCRSVADPRDSETTGSAGSAGTILREAGPVGKAKPIAKSAWAAAGIVQSLRPPDRVPVSMRPRCRRKCSQCACRPRKSRGCEHGCPCRSRHVHIYSVHIPRAGGGGGGRPPSVGHPMRRLLGLPMVHATRQAAASGACVVPGFGADRVRNRRIQPRGPAGRRQTTVALANAMAACAASNRGHLFVLCDELPQPSSYPPRKGSHRIFHATAAITPHGIHRTFHTTEVGVARCAVEPAFIKDSRLVPVYSRCIHNPSCTFANWSILGVGVDSGWGKGQDGEGDECSRGEGTRKSDHAGIPDTESISARAVSSGHRHGAARRDADRRRLRGAGTE